MAHPLVLRRNNNKNKNIEHMEKFSNQIIEHYKSIKDESSKEEYLNFLSHIFDSLDD